MFEKRGQGLRREAIFEKRGRSEKTGKAGEDEDADGEEGDEQTQLLVAAMKCVAEGLEPGGVPCKLEDAQDPHDAEDLDHPTSIVDLRGRHSSGLGPHQLQASLIFSRSSSSLLVLFEPRPLSQTLSSF